MSDQNATPLAMTSEIILERRRKSRNLRVCIYLVLTLLVAWSVQVTIIEDTDWERMGSLGNVLESANRFLGIDYALLATCSNPPSKPS